MSWLRNTGKILAFSHIPKTAGMTLNYLLRRHFGCGHLSVSYRGNQVVYTARDLKRDLRIQPFIKSISGHSLKPFVDFREFSLCWYTYLRNPVDRFISHYQYEVEKGGKRCSFREWYKTFHRENWQVRMLAGEEDLLAAKQILLEKFVFVGVQEHFDESLLILRSRLGIDDFEVSYAKPINASQSGIIRTNIGQNYESYEAEILEQNRLDIELYQFVTEEIWSRQLRDYGVENMQSDLRSCFGKLFGLQKRIEYGIKNIAYLSQRNLIYKPFVAFEKRTASARGQRP